MSRMTNLFNGKESNVKSYFDLIRLTCLEGQEFWENLQLSPILWHFTNDFIPLPVIFFFLVE